jgi:hypothetical protein
MYTAIDTYATYAHSVLSRNIGGTGIISVKGKANPGNAMQNNPKTTMTLQGGKKSKKTGYE